jgi:hypothetical protein
LAIKRCQGVELLRNQDLLHSHDECRLDFEETLNDRFDLFAGNVLDVQTGLLRFDEEFGVFKRIVEGSAQ